MKILIITASLGQGHNSVASCLTNQFEIMGHECKTVDMYEYISPVLKEIISKGYIFTVGSAAKLRPIAKEVYQLNESRQIDSDEISLSSIMNRFEASELRKFIDYYNPDAIICTQVYAAQAIDLLETKGCTNAFSVGIITDFTVQTYWQDTVNLDCIVAASEQLEYQLSQRGITHEKILPCGIPISPKFKNRVAIDEARKRLDLDANLPTMLIMGGSMGYGKIDEAIEELDLLPFDFQAMVVCGNNQKLLNKLTSTNTQHKFRIFGYTNEVDLMMDASDLIITKPGGITSSEALAKGLPIVIYCPIPGMEERNAEFLAAAGAAVCTSRTFTVSEAVSMVLCYPQNKQRMSQAALALSHPDSTQTFCEFIESRLPSFNKKKNLLPF